MRFIFILLLSIVVTTTLSAQSGLTKHGQFAASGSDFVDKNGQLTSAPMLSANGQVLAITLSTLTPYSITSNSALGGGFGISSPTTGVTSYGICWSVGANPTTADAKTQSVGSAISFTGHLISGLSSSTLYHVRAYATNSLGTYYGNDLTFTTLP